MNRNLELVRQRIDSISAEFKRLDSEWDSLRATMIDTDSLRAERQRLIGGLKAETEKLRSLMQQYVEKIDSLNNKAVREEDPSDD